MLIQLICLVRSMTKMWGLVTVLYPEVNGEYMFRKKNELGVVCSDRLLR
jgi:hypothetical protein